MAKPANGTDAGHVDAVRRFNRFYTGRIGALGHGHLGSPYSLTEVRVLYEIAHRDGATATDLQRELGLDAGYASRMLARFVERGLVRRAPAGDDARRRLVTLTARGRAQFAKLDARASAEIEEMLGTLPAEARSAVVTSLARAHSLLDRDAGGSGKPYTLRAHRPGDMGWVVHRHGALYAAEYGWDERFEALVARIVADFIDHLDPERERCWIAERDGAIVGSVFLVKKSARVGKLRLLLVEPSARGLGLGCRLVNECIAFARAAGYRKVVLWTQSNLTAARHIYRGAGFEVVASEKHDQFGAALVSETWELRL